jgi:hypothetical protein
LIRRKKHAQQHSITRNLADALSTAMGGKYDAAKLPFQTIAFSADGKFVSFTADSKKWKYDLQSGGFC